MDSASRPRRRERVLAQSSGETLILLATDSGEYFTLDEVGGKIWDLADGTRTVEEIARTLAGEYDAPVATIQADALEILGELADERLLDDGRASA